MSKPLCVIVGYGSGIGHGVAKAFGGAGSRLGLIARNPEKHAASLAELREKGIDFTPVAADAGDAAALTRAVESLTAGGGAEVLIYNAISGKFGQPTAISPDQLVADFRVNVGGALAAARAILPALPKEGGAIYFTGGGWAHYPWDGAASMSLGKAALRNLAFTLGQELAGRGVAVRLISVMGPVERGTAFDPDMIGEFYLKSHRAGTGDEVEVMFKG